MGTGQVAEAELQGEESKVRTWMFVIGFMLGSIFGFSGVVSFVELIEKETEKVVTMHGREIPKCEKPLWERIKDGCDESTTDSQ